MTRSGGRSADRRARCRWHASGAGATSSCGTPRGSSRSGRSSATRWRCGCRSQRDRRNALGVARPQGAQPGPQGREERLHGRGRRRRTARRLLQGVRAQHARPGHAGLRPPLLRRGACARFPTTRACSSCAWPASPSPRPSPSAGATALEVPWASSLRAHAAQVAEHAAVLGDAAVGGAAGLHGRSISAARRRTRARSTSRNSGAPSRRSWRGSTWGSPAMCRTRARRTRSSGRRLPCGSTCRFHWRPRLDRPSSGTSREGGQVGRCRAGPVPDARRVAGRRVPHGHRLPQHPGAHGNGKRAADTGLVWALLWLAGYGDLGVPLFFVISGYCISAAADRARRHDHPVRTYFIRRFRRIYPPLWAVIAASILFFVAVDYVAWPGLLSSCPLAAAASLVVQRLAVGRQSHADRDLAAPLRRRAAWPLSRAGMDALL